MKWAFEIGQHVRPREEWRGDPNDIPTGPVAEREPWGRDGCFRIEGEDRRFWSAHCLEAAA